jgi:hypothetical protein
VERTDELVREYLLFRGFTHTLRQLDAEIKADKEKGFRVRDQKAWCGSGGPGEPGSGWGAPPPPPPPPGGGAAGAHPALPSGARAALSPLCGGP